MRRPFRSLRYFLIEWPSCVKCIITLSYAFSFCYSFLFFTFFMFCFKIALYRGINWPFYRVSPILLLFVLANTFRWDQFSIVRMFHARSSNQHSRPWGIEKKIIPNVNNYIKVETNSGKFQWTETVPKKNVRSLLVCNIQTRKEQEKRN